MRMQVPEFFQRLADAFLAGDHAWLSGIYVHPLVVYIEGEILVEHDAAHTIENLFERRQMALLAGTRSIRADTLEVGETSRGRFPVRVDWRFLSDTGREITRNELRYYCRLSPEGEPRIEILEFIRRGFDPSGNVRRSPVQ